MYMIQNFKKAQKDLECKTTPSVSRTCPVSPNPRTARIADACCQFPLHPSGFFSHTDVSTLSPLLYTR